MEGESKVGGPSPDEVYWGTMMNNISKRYLVSLSVSRYVVRLSFVYFLPAP
jgi:hypothetical protein